jgi:predicted aspartyl protease
VGRILVPVMINGQGPFRLVVDTGASHSTISPRVAAALGLDPAGQPPILVNGITGSAELPTVPIERLEAGSLVAEHLRVPVVWASLMAGADGILGAAGWTGERLFVDFDQNRVTVGRFRHTSAVTDFMRIPAKRLPDGLLMVAGRMGDVAVQAIIDTGSERTLGNLALSQALHARRSGAKAVATEVYGATDEISPGQVEVAPPIWLGGVRVSDVAVVYGDFHIFEVWNLRDRPAVIIGMDILGAVHKLAIDFARAEIFLNNFDPNTPYSGRGPSMLSGRLGR